MALSENRKYLSRQEMERLAFQILPVQEEFSSSDFYKHCEKKGIKKSTASSMLHKMKHSKMIDDIGKDPNSKNGRLYYVRDYWQQN